MVKKFNLSEAAAEILGASISSAKKGAEGSSRLPTSVVTGQKEVGDIGTQVTMTTDGGPDGAKGVPTATPPGPKPALGAEPMKRLARQPGEDSATYQGEPEGKPGKQMMQKNANGVGIQSYDGQTNESLEDFIVSEDFEQLDELSKGVLRNYINKAGTQVLSAAAAANSGMKFDDKQKAKLMKRGDSVDNAVDKLRAKKEMKEDIDALLQGEDLSEEFVTKATTIFEAAVMSRVEELAEEVEAQMQEQFEVAIEELKEDFASKIDDYLNYMVEEWMKDNELAIESGLRSEIVEDFIGGLRNLFAEHYIDIPEEKVDVVQEMADKVEELETKLNEEISRSIEFKKEINEHKKVQAVQAVCEGLTQTQVEKLKSLAESVEFTTEDEFAEKINTLKEAYTPSNVKTVEKSVLQEGVEVPEDKPTRISDDPLVNAAVNSISKSVVK